MPVPREVLYWIIWPAQVQGTPFCFAAGTTGGGNAKPAAPSSLKVYTYDTPRALLIDREWNLTGTEDTTNDRCCVTKVTTCEGGTSKGQAWIQDKCADGKFEPCKWDNAARKAIEVGSNKEYRRCWKQGCYPWKGSPHYPRQQERDHPDHPLHFKFRFRAPLLGVPARLYQELNPQSLSLVATRSGLITTSSPSSVVSTSSAAGSLPDTSLSRTTNSTAALSGLLDARTLLLIGEKDYYTFIDQLRKLLPRREITTSRTSVVIPSTSIQHLDAPLSATCGSPLAPQSPILPSRAALSSTTSPTPRLAVAAIARSCEVGQLSKSAQFPRADADVLKKAGTYKASIPPNTPVANVPKNVTANAGVAKLK
ncbi:hypothetical protein BDV23DRAFT_178061 [Aspergillus alliaceus]|uniref:Uncharacterized protein n=1 Tax=Petromyces alliaceus TaxID=209559 RepID=A0A5N7CPF1_PETAA|nr:hypothetical protein BDV23DRAFT_178061 [Aspergillus alliaceus]